jgi:excisionase family DNA binding protein
LLTADELATALKVRTSTVYDWHRFGRIRGYKLAYKTVRFRLSEVLADVRARAEGAP